MCYVRTVRGFRASPAIASNRPRNQRNHHPSFAFPWFSIFRLYDKTKKKTIKKHNEILEHYRRHTGHPCTSPSTTHSGGSTSARSAVLVQLGVQLPVSHGLGSFAIFHPAGPLVCARVLSCTDRPTRDHSRAPRRVGVNAMWSNYTRCLPLLRSVRSPVRTWKSLYFQTVSAHFYSVWAYHFFLLSQWWPKFHQWNKVHIGYETCILHGHCSEDGIREAAGRCIRKFQRYEPAKFLQLYRTLLFAISRGHASLHLTSLEF